MKHLLAGLCLAAVVAGCKTGKARIVDVPFADSLLQQSALPAAIKNNAGEMQFWKNRIVPQTPGIVSESKYAGALATRFHLLGNIADLQQADSVMRQIDSLYNHKEPGVLLSLVTYSILQHRFKEADLYLQKAKTLGIKRYESLTSAFDVDFELGRYSNAALELKLMKPANDYGYYFRRSKMDHFNGRTDSSIQAMLRASQLAGNSQYLQQAALSNVADLYTHTGELQQAAGLYTQCIRANSADVHSIMGLGWIALVHDNNDSLAERLFLFAQAKNQSPDPFLKLSQVAEARGDTALQKTYARRFEAQATHPEYGNMYNKYLIDLYTGIFNEPLKALALATKELSNRATPQTYAWYAWSLVASNKKDDAWETYRQHVSGKPLEGPELYYMGKLMQALGKGYNAHEFFKAAANNKYDLSPALAKDLEKKLHE